jgi:hypothetical protein
MSANNLVKLSTYRNEFGFKVPYLLEIGYPQETNYTAICYPIGNSIFGGNFALDVDYRLIDGTSVNPYNLYTLNSGSKSNISLTKEILKMIFDKRIKKNYKVGTLSRDFGFEFKLNSITCSSCSITISVSDGSKVFVSLRLYSLVDVNKWGSSNPTKNFYLKLLSDNFPTKDNLYDCAKQLYKVKNSLLAMNRNLIEVTNVNK